MECLSTAPCSQLFNSHTLVFPSDQRINDKMTEVAPAAAAAPAAKTAKKKASMRKIYGPSAGELIVRAVAASKERGGVSASAVKKALAAGGYDVDRNKGRIKTAIKALVTKGTLVQTKGTGASGSFKISKKAADKPAKEVAVITRKPAAAKKSKTAAAKKPAAGKKSPKKAKKPAAKSPKKAAKSPKKAVKSPKKVVKKAPKAKTPVKKAVKPKAKKAAPKKK